MGWVQLFLVACIVLQCQSFRRGPGSLLLNVDPESSLGEPNQLQRWLMGSGRRLERYGRRGGLYDEDLESDTDLEVGGDREPSLWCLLLRQLLGITSKRAIRQYEDVLLIIRTWLKRLYALGRQGWELVNLQLQRCRGWLRSTWSSGCSWYRSLSWPDSSGWTKSLSWPDSSSWSKSLSWPDSSSWTKSLSWPDSHGWINSVWPSCQSWLQTNWPWCQSWLHSTFPQHSWLISLIPHKTWLESLEQKVSPQKGWLETLQQHLSPQQSWLETVGHKNTPKKSWIESVEQKVSPKKSWLESVEEKVSPQKSWLESVGGDLQSNWQTALSDANALAAKVKNVLNSEGLKTSMRVLKLMSGSDSTGWVDQISSLISGNSDDLLDGDDEIGGRRAEKRERRARRTQRRRRARQQRRQNRGRLYDDDDVDDDNEDDVLAPLWNMVGV